MWFFFSIKIEYWIDTSRKIRYINGELSRNYKLHYDLDLNAVIMVADSMADRTEDATKLLNYGSSTCQKYKEQENHVYYDIPIQQGVKESITGATNQIFSYVDIRQNNLEDIQILVVYDDR